uniref:Dirigent protein n=1 Tax=Aegilops tauschii subsp. strangulata TaxID=200361 RepID=A0A453QS79_AEGTS
AFFSPSLALPAMAGPSGILFLLVIAMPAFLALADTPHPYCDRPCQNELSLHLYLHQFVAGPNRPNRNEEFVLTPGYPLGFGTTLIHDWTLTNTVNPSDTIIARAQGTHIQASRTNANGWYISQNIVFQSGRFAGSTLQVMGTLTEQSDGQWSVIGGTGEFTKAHGTIKYKMDPASNIEDGIRELDIHLIYTPNYPQATQSGTAALAKLLGGCHAVDNCCCKKY